MQFGVMSAILRQSGPEVVETAAALGFTGVELDVNRGEEANPLLSEQGRADVMAVAARHQVSIPSICLGALNRFSLKSADEAERDRARAFILNGITAARDLGARVILVPFFGHAELTTRDDLVRVAEGIRGLAPVAQQSGAVLAIENTIPVSDSLFILEQIDSPAVGVYYDAGNATSRGYDPAAEIRTLGSRMAQIHFKDTRRGGGGTMLGQGDVDYPAVATALREIGYDGWVVLETSAPTDPIADARANLDFTRRLLARHPASSDA